MDIVPLDDTLVIAVQIQPQDIDKIEIGSRALIRLSAFNQRTTPELWGEIMTVSGDRLVDPETGLPYYLTLIAIPEDADTQLGGLILIPGMPVEAFIRTGERSVISYFLKPLSDSVARAFREE